MHHRVRTYTDQDLAPIIALFTETVWQVNSRDYTPEQIEAWAPRKTDPDRWRTRLTGLSIIVAEVDGQIAGFCGFAETGHIDFLYVDHRLQRRGLASALYQYAENELRARCVNRLFTEASITARPFFERMGFSVVREQMVQVRGTELRNHAMEKLI